MANELSGRTVVVSGATSGIGAATARHLARDGARIVALGRRAKRLERLREELGPACHVMAVDVADGAALARMFAALPPAFATVDVLINNAGVALGNDKAQDADAAKWQAMVDTNIGGVLALTRLLLPGMVARDRGDIVNIGSVAGSWPYPTGNVYGATKAFIRQFTLNLRADLLGRNVRAICVEPGTVRTEFAAVRTGSSASADAFYGHPNLMYPEDVAEIVAFCLRLPRRVNINMVEAMPLGQAFSAPIFADDMAELEPPPHGGGRQA
ncbi:SDR family NAD(P)-dependent oxidoreductase [Vineibacter terrae]|uniref:SDR family NAD(P)-dependent oxidoreductase n=1 Tax=Vineibacter terrae TaxID=2586908 RepID=A0A5C8PI66_9HYPH|nr:SDR family NAD(P)-dependent oxidoreductase [Vineibacter terrae]TXL73493.1 SDR family NAD(P)-dependent oxidoreductase [Vineibacter terrae]